jgi:hypothetical protein
MQNYRNTTKIHRGHITILGLCAPTEGREELSEEFCETLQEKLDKVRKEMITYC